jgi:hypothetical protein
MGLIFLFLILNAFLVVVILIFLFTIPCIILVIAFIRLSGGARG